MDIGLNCYQFGCRRRLQRRGLACTKALMFDQAQRCSVPHSTAIGIIGILRHPCRDKGFLLHPSDSADVGETITTGAS